jgi:hypothetical protein
MIMYEKRKAKERKRKNKNKIRWDKKGVAVAKWLK